MLQSALSDLLTSILFVAEADGPDLCLREAYLVALPNDDLCQPPGEWLWP